MWDFLCTTLFSSTSLKDELKWFVYFFQGHGSCVSDFWTLYFLQFIKVFGISYFNLNCEFIDISCYIVVGRMT